MKKVLVCLIVLGLLMASWPDSSQANCVIVDSKGTPIPRGDCYGVVLKVKDGFVYVNLSRAALFAYGRGWPLIEFYGGTSCQGQGYLVSYYHSLASFYEYAEYVDETNVYYAALSGPSIDGSDPLSFVGSDGVCYQVDPTFFAGYTLTLTTSTPHGLVPPFKLR